MTAYAELQVTSNFSFLRGASHADELVTAAADLGRAALCFPTDRDAYGRLSKLLTLGKRRAEKGECVLGFADGPWRGADSGGPAAPRESTS